MSDHDTVTPETDDELRARLQAFALEVKERTDTEAPLERMPRRSRPPTIRLVAIAACHVPGLSKAPIRSQCRRARSIASGARSSAMCGDLETAAARATIAGYSLRKKVLKGGGAQLLHRRLVRRGRLFKHRHASHTPADRKTLHFVLAVAIAAVVMADRQSVDTVPPAESPTTECPTPPSHEPSPQEDR
jgi:hypothetical protein